ncbi:hypothetical protein H696_05672 [Fonticula alba]|uniref:Uncharacterized protein n=1 Tax=Fonticula alba TaxID=691883 RepID=A0A058Z365_FONAL|nr:hypothetical protein H696_05672 [Fonticula alba]KCV67947.1 hypothetical protein H696_05672 [Fonticula alba]|eukprot:XP_009497767.1 hypothetical protein H696_05672 [Fonticula alba]
MSSHNNPMHKADAQKGARPAANAQTQSQKGAAGKDCNTKDQACNTRSAKANAACPTSKQQGAHNTRSQRD